MSWRHWRLTFPDALRPDTFLGAYLEAAVWSSTDLDGRPLDEDYSVDDLSVEFVRRAAEDCDAFQAQCAADLAEVGTDAQNGLDFWLTRNRHGAGFWDQGYGPVGNRLTEAAHVYGSVDLLPDDEGELS